MSLTVSLKVDRMTDGTFDVVLSLAGLTFRRLEQSEADAMIAANEAQGVLEAAGLEFEGWLTAPGSPSSGKVER